MLSCAHFFLKILQSLPVSYRVQTPPCSLGSTFWALLTFLASFPYKSLSYMLIYSIFLREVYFLPQCPYAALPLLEPFLSLPFNMESGRGFKDRFPQLLLECQMGTCHSSVFRLLQPQNKCILTSIFHTCHPAPASLPGGDCEHLDCRVYALFPTPSAGQ